MDLVAQLNTSLGGRYAIDREIGRGGMATVYLARDIRHDRRVALKVLNPELGAVLGVERFLAEIKVTANLQHPNLLALFDSGDVDGHLFYVMPFVEGESLRARLNREKQLPVDEAVRIASAIAGALGYAHRHGVVHRDLKPENVLLHEGQPLVADFGIALAVSNAGGARITQTGISLGTPQYMSPEQATGDRAIDGRTDIYSLGAITYEMLVGDPPHLGSTSQAVIAKVLTERPHSVRTGRPTVPRHVDAAVARALEKFPADRFASAQEFADAMAGKLAVATIDEPLSVATTPVQTGARRRVAGIRDVVYGTVILAVAAFGVIQRRPAHERRPVVRFQVALPRGHQFNDGLLGNNVAVSPHGDRIAYVAVAGATGASQVYMRSTDQFESKPLTQPGAAIRTPVFSPDGKWLAYVEGNEVRKVSIDGGAPAVLATLPDVPVGVSWGVGGSIAAGTVSNGIFVVPENGGNTVELKKRAGESSSAWPLILDDGKTVVYSATTTSITSGALRVRSLDGSDSADVLDLAVGMPLAHVEGMLVYGSRGTIMAVPFDARRRRVTGVAIPVIQDVLTDPLGGYKAAVSASGMLVYRGGGIETQPVLIHGSSITPLVAEPRAFSTPRFSPDGKRVAVTVTTAQGTDVWIADPVQGTLARVTSTGTALRPEWTADGRRILFLWDRDPESVFAWQPADASAPAEILYKPEEGNPFEGMLSDDGKWLVYRTGPAGRPPRSVLAVSLEKRGKSIPLLAGGSYFQMPRLSPDGHWLAYQSNVSGRFEVYVRPFPDSGGRIQISVGGGTEPMWARSGPTLFYRTTQGVMSVKVSGAAAALSIGERKLALTGDFLTNPSHANYDVSPDGTRFLMIRRAGDDVQTVVVLNWIEELRARIAGGR